ncbi:fimbria/pilus periplasmic chaperone [Sphingopyxis sp.]|uniref:fimbria/pilus periplasmic chaperone n=1 Tax=Sphingopyxis sp. TaxID=1908224 RepID=UPI002ED90002
MFRKSLMLAVAAASLALGAAPSEAARVTPMTVEMSPTGRGSTARIKVTNSENRNLPVELRMYRGDVNEAGELMLTPADDKFVVFPPQVVISPNAQQVFRIQYLPGEPLTKSEVYYAAVTQIPVDLDPAISRIQVVMRFNVLVNVVPDGSTPDPVVTSARALVRETVIPPDEKLPVEEQKAKTVTEKGIEVRIENRGTRFFAAGRTGWTIAGTREDGTAFSESRTPGRMSDAIGFGLVPPGGARVFFVPVDEPLRAEGVKITLGG